MQNEKKFSFNDYVSGVYVNKDRWVGYYLQTSLISKLLSSGSVMEVGVGNGVVANYLKSKYSVTTVDTNALLKPDHIGSIEDLSFLPADNFDVVLCAEVLEHLPFNRLSHCVAQLGRVSKQFVVISIPYWGYTFGFKLRLPKMGTKVIKFKLSGILKHAYNGQHFWEVGKRGFSLRKVKSEIEKSHLKIVRSFWDIDDPYHMYFVLKK